jgi:spore maturation protein B
MQYFSGYIIPVVIVLILFAGVLRRQKVFDLFLAGAREGVGVAFRVLPALVGLMVAVSMFRASGAFDLIVAACAPISGALHFPGEVIPLALMRPISGSGSLSVYEQLLGTYGPDSTIGRIASVMQGSTETTFYTLAVYYGSVNVSRTRHTLPAALLADFMGFAMSILSVKLLLGQNP